MDLDEFSDDGFDDLPADALQELERNAIQLTQAPSKAGDDGAAERAPSYGWEDEDDDLDTTEVTNDVGVPIGRPVIDNTLQQRQKPRPTTESEPPRRLGPPAPNPRWNPTIMSGARPPAGGMAGALGRMPSVGPPSSTFSASQRFQHQPGHGRMTAAPQASQFARPALPEMRFAGSSQGAAPGAQGDVMTALQQRVRALEKELESARGEAAIVRSKANKAQEEYDSHVARLKKVNAEQMAEKERIAEAAVAAEKSANTELQFLQRDMKEVSDRARRKDGTSLGSGAVTTANTPKKNSRTWGFADGFDEMDIAISPSKGQGRGKVSGSVAANVGERTPSKGKRKRPPIDSPVAALDTSTDDVVMADDAAKTEPKVVQVSTVIAAPAAPFEYLQLVLDHGSFHQQPPTFDILSHFYFPSEPTGPSFASMIFEKLPLMGNPYRPMQLLVDFSEHILSLWARCVEEVFWEPVKYLASLIAFTFDLHTSSVAPLIVPNLVPTAQATMYALLDARRRLPESGLAHNPEYSFLAEHIDIAQLMNLLYTAALACSTTPTEADSGPEYTPVGFWRLLPVELVMMLLQAKQNPDDVVGMLELLATSVLPESIGPLSDMAEPAAVARAVIERVSGRLTEPVRPTMTAEQRRTIRLAALRTLIAFSASPFGAMQLATHDNAVPRLVTCLSGAIDELYDQPIPPNILPPLPESSTLKLPDSCASPDLYRIVSQSVLLVHRLATDARTSNAIEISRKLSLSHGGSQRYLLALGRLAFAEEDLVIEAGIEGEVVEAAHELLEMAVTPDEGETISEAFGA